MAFERPHKSVRFFPGDCIEAMKGMDDNTLDSVVTDPPYHLQSVVKRFSSPDAAPLKDYEGGTGVYKRSSAGFMGKAWDGGDISFKPEFWAEVLRIMKPGAHLLAFGGTRTSHRMVCALEDAGFEIRDTVAWVYGQGFPKSHDVSKDIDKALDAEREVIGNGKAGHTAIGATTRFETGYRPQLQDNSSYNITIPTTDEAKQWDGWGTALKPAVELICLARKPLSESTVAENVLAWGTGALNIDGCRVESDGAHKRSFQPTNNERSVYGKQTGFQPTNAEGRWPANLVHDGSDEVVGMFPDVGKSPPIGSMGGGSNKHSIYGDFAGQRHENGFGDSGSAARFFYQAKANKEDRAGSRHPTIKPIALLQWLIRLITPPNGWVFDPFAGSGTTGHAALLEGFHSILCENEVEYQDDIRRRFADPALLDIKPQHRDMIYRRLSNGHARPARKPRGFVPKELDLEVGVNPFLPM